MTMARFINIFMFVAVTSVISAWSRPDAPSESCQVAPSESCQAADSASSRHGAEGFANQVVDQVSLAQLSLKLNIKHHQQLACTDIGGPLPPMKDQVCDNIMHEFCGSIDKLHKTTAALSTLVYPASIKEIAGYGEFLSSLKAIADWTKEGSQAIRGVVCAQEPEMALEFATALKATLGALTPAFTEYFKMYKLVVGPIAKLMKTDKDFERRLKESTGSKFSFRSLALEPVMSMVTFDAVLTRLAKEGEKEKNGRQAGGEGLPMCAYDTTGVPEILTVVKATCQEIDSASGRWDSLKAGVNVFAKIYKLVGEAKIAPVREDSAMQVARAEAFTKQVKFLQTRKDTYMKDIKNLLGENHHLEDLIPLGAPAIESYCLMRQFGFLLTSIEKHGISLQKGKRVMWNAVAHGLTSCGPEVARILEIAIGNCGGSRDCQESQPQFCNCGAEKKARQCVYDFMAEPRPDQCSMTCLVLNDLPCAE